MKKYALVTTKYCDKCSMDTNEQIKKRFNYDGDENDFYVNFSDKFSPWNQDIIPKNIRIKSNRADLIYGKIFLLRNFIEREILNKYEYLLHIDYSDTKFNRSYIELMETLISEGYDFLISVEKKMWPPFESVNSWFNEEIVDEEFNFLNSGVIFSKVDTFYGHLLSLEKIVEETNLSLWDDQGVWQYYDLHGKNLKKDVESKYFFSTANLNDDDYSINDKKIFNLFGYSPYIIHDNGSQNLNLINKIQYHV